MMMKTKIILSALFICSMVFGQQDPQFTMYMMNPFIVNPALAGTADYYQIRTNHRFQYAGFKDAPVTNSMSFFGPDSKRNFGYGGGVFNDLTGITSRSGVNGVFSYSKNITKDINVSGGLGLGVMQYKMDFTKIQLIDNVSDVSINGNVKTVFLPDGSTGIYVWNTDFYGGFSIQHLFNNKVKVDPAFEDDNRLALHYYVVGGYKKDISTGRKPQMWVIEPSLLLKKVVPASWQLETNVKLTYNNMLWTGLSFRTQDAISLMFGYLYKRQIFIAYSVDLSVNAIRKYSYGSHELSIGYNFSNIKGLKIKKPTGKKKK